MCIRDRLSGARLDFGDRVLWDHLDLSVSKGEFIAVLGPNGTGKTSLLKVLLGQLPLTAGRAFVPGSGQIGYVPQHRPIDREVLLRGRDLVQLGIDGRRWGIMPLRSADRALRGLSLIHISIAHKSSMLPPAPPRSSATATPKSPSSARPANTGRQASALPESKPCSICRIAVVPPSPEPEFRAQSRTNSRAANCSSVTVATTCEPSAFSM